MARPYLYTIISDVHGFHERLEIRPCDFLLICGDVTNRGRFSYGSFYNWVLRVPADNVIFVFGNHERAVKEKFFTLFKNIPKVHILQNAFEIIKGVQFFGLGFPVQERVVEWVNTVAIKDMPTVLLTHEPPFGILDMKMANPKKGEVGYKHAGSEVIKELLNTLQPQLACFGHLHYSFGAVRVDDTLCVNAAVVNEFGKVANKPVEAISFSKFFVCAHWNDFVKEKYELCY
ncbi:hypothetical protein EIN_359460 [Entamoeba invadens IP1]|uniref:Calcineurin-like phosphoesterase domain-containing protein n=1 Tax=Entamoeba invadens IP1 TaxID=370355 RepID=A0A0A1U7L7_ENTIV|nr:hypothetical protein EIN_359460 [Entamoeba invadens IP1]ELP90863.1 hypothetical protein EIN_359460 [Entamoeba invadens IP1]|eukprot:XP_004257634.1 hypothetical protein EIN_359460 [Entamoeba invadens IP1]